jgi:hypothetical protein
MFLTDILIDKIKRDYADDISIVHIHGSYAYDDSHELSDLDIYIVPKTKRGFNLGCTFIFDGIGCDFWTLSWERLERIASHEEQIASIITNGKVIYHGSDEDLTRFERLKARAANTGNVKEWYKRARKALDEVYKEVFIIQRSEALSEVRAHTIGLIYSLSFALAQLNLTTIKRGRKLLKEEILAMPRVPDDFGKLYDTLFMSCDINIIKAACVSLLLNTEKLVSAVAAESAADFADMFGGWYEEMSQNYNKIYHACEIGDIYTPLYAAAELSHDLDIMLRQTGISPVLPDMAAAYDSGDLEKIKAAAKEHQKAFEALLRDNGVEPIVFSTIEEVKNFIDMK